MIGKAGSTIAASDLRHALSPVANSFNGLLERKFNVQMYFLEIYIQVESLETNFGQKLVFTANYCKKYMY